MTHFHHTYSLHNKREAFLRMFLMTVSVVAISGLISIFLSKGSFAALGFGIVVLFVATILIFYPQYFSVLLPDLDGGNETWHIELNEQKLIWQAPQHAYGKEVNFDVFIKDIEKIERHCLIGYDVPHQVEYFLKLKCGKKIQLRNFSGIALDEFCLAISKLGILVENKEA